MDDAKHDKITRRGADRHNSSMRGTMARSDGVNPGRSTLVESLNSASTPSFPYLANECKSNCAPPTGVWSILKSPVWITTPRGVRIATATQSTMLSYTKLNSISYD